MHSVFILSTGKSPYAGQNRKLTGSERKVHDVGVDILNACTEWEAINGHLVDIFEQLAELKINAM